MASQTTIGSTKVPLALHYVATDIANSNGTLTDAALTSNEYIMPVGGSIIGYSVNLDGTLTTGTLTFAATVNGTVASTDFSVSPLTSQSSYQTMPAETVRFNAGDSVGLMWTKSGTVAPTTRDAAGLLIVLLDRYDY